VNIEKLLAGSIDLHVHCAPDPFVERRVDALQLAQQARQAGMRTVVIKSHEFCTAPLAKIINQLNGDSILTGSLVLNHSVGGLNPAAVEAAALAGAKIIWMPTTSSSEDPKLIKQGKTAVSLLDGKGDLVLPIDPILEIMKKHCLTLATGHISLPETLAVAEKALQQQIQVIITHPFAKVHGTSLNMDQARALAIQGAFIEFCFLACMPPTRLTPAAVIEHIRALGVEHCILSTDFGQMHNPPPTEGFRTALAYLLKAGLTEREFAILAKENPARLLNL
jgi:hypothetical protein